MADSVAVTIAAIVSIAAIAVAALVTGNDGVLAGTALATISGLAGVGIGYRMGRSRRG